MNAKKKTSHQVLKTAVIVLSVIMLWIVSVTVVPKIVRRVENYQIFMTAKYRAEQIVSDRYGTGYAISDTRTQYAYPSPPFGNWTETKIEYMEFDFFCREDIPSGFIIQVSVKDGKMKLYRDGLPLATFS